MHKLSQKTTAQHPDIKHKKQQMINQRAKQLKKQKDRAKRFGLDINKNMEDGEIDENEINKVS